MYLVETEKGEPGLVVETNDRRVLLETEDIKEVHRYWDKWSIEKFGYPKFTITCHYPDGDRSITIERMSIEEFAKSQLLDIAVCQIKNAEIAQ